jgi:hypothetical protein
MRFIILHNCCSLDLGTDCGYVYDRDIDGGGLYFEQQQRGFM